jgi:hypothetical protein
MNGKHAKVLQAVFRAPTPANIDWSDLECGFRRDRARHSDLMPPTIPI